MQVGILTVNHHIGNGKGGKLLSYSIILKRLITYGDSQPIDSSGYEKINQHTVILHMIVRIYDHQCISQLP